MYKLYTTLSNPASFGGFKRLVNTQKNVQIQKLQNGFRPMMCTLYTLHKPLRKKFLRRRVVVSGLL